MSPTKPVTPHKQESGLQRLEKMLKSGSGLKIQRNSIWRKMIQICPFCGESVEGDGVMLRCVHRAHRKCLEKSKITYCSHCRGDKI